MEEADWLGQEQRQRIYSRLSEDEKDMVDTALEVARQWNCKRGAKVFACYRHARGLGNKKDLPYLVRYSKNYDLFQDGVIGFYRRYLVDGRGRSSSSGGSASS